METLEIESQTDQTPLASGRLDPAQGELAEAEHLLDDADHRFNRAFACPVDRFSQGRLELVGHLDLGTRVFSRRIGQRREALLPTGMMGITASGDIGLDAAFGTGSQRHGAEVAGVQSRRIGRAKCGRDALKRGVGFLTIVRMIGEGAPHDE